MTGVAVVVAATALVVIEQRYRRFVVAAAFGFAVHPLLGVAAPGALAVVERMRAIGAQRRARGSDRTEEILAVELVAAGVSAGVSFDAAVHTVAAQIGGPVGSEMTGRLRSLRHGLTSEESLDTLGPAARMMRLARRSESSGARLADELESLAATEIAIDAALTEERLERLPVTMLFPLALLILPGFLLVAVAPAVIGGIARLGL